MFEFNFSFFDVGRYSVDYSSLCLVSIVILIFTFATKDWLSHQLQLQAVLFPLLGLILALIYAFVKFFNSPAYLNIISTFFPFLIVYFVWRGIKIIISSESVS